MKFSMFNIMTKDRHGNDLLLNPITNTYLRISAPNCRSEEEVADALYNSKYRNELVEKKIFVEDSIDYDAIIDEIYDKKVIHRERMDIVILTTNACNFDCVYCFQHKHLSRLNSKHYDSVLKFIEDRAEEYKNVTIRWFGGEPLLELEQILPFSDKLRELCKTHKMSFGATMTTNGYLLNYETFEKLYKCNVVSYQISLDGTAEAHNRTRPLKGGGASYDKIVDNLVEIHKRAPYRLFNITVRVNFTRELLEEVDRLVEYLKDVLEGDDRFTFAFIPVFDWSSTEDEQSKAQDLSKHLTSRQGVYEAMKDKASILRFNAWSELLLGNNNCWAGTKHGYAINGDGTILKCDFKLEGFKENVVGKITENGYEFLEEANEKWIFEKPLKECYQCKYFTLCLSTMCGASRVEKCMESKCLVQKEFIDNCLEVESYSNNGNFKDVIL